MENDYRGDGKVEEERNGMWNSFSSALSKYSSSDGLAEEIKKPKKGADNKKRTIVKRSVAGSIVKEKSQETKKSLLKKVISSFAPLVKS